MELRRERVRSFRRCNLCTSTALCSRLFFFFLFLTGCSFCSLSFLRPPAPPRREILSTSSSLSASRDIPAHSCVSCHSDLGSLQSMALKPLLGLIRSATCEALVKNYLMQKYAALFQCKQKEKDGKTAFAPSIELYSLQFFFSRMKF